MMDQMVDCLNTQPHVTFMEVKADIFKDYETLFSSFYNQFPPRTIQKNHIFWVDSTNSTTMMMKTSHDAQSMITTISKENKFSHDNRLRQLKAVSLSAITCPGIKPIKQVELYKKWQLFIPHQFHYQICPRPTDEGLKVVRNEKNQSQGIGQQGRRGEAETRRVAASPSQGFLVWCKLLTPTFPFFFF
jgi:hypothetical protein